MRRLNDVGAITMAGAALVLFALFLLYLSK
jgi:hypothetical protein